MPPVTILSDARWQGPHGIGRFASEVLRRLPAHTRLNRGPRPLSVADPPWLLFQIMKHRPDVFFSPGFNPPPLPAAPFVFTIHDLIQIRLPGAATPLKSLYYDLVVKPACRRAYRVLTVSEWSRAQIAAWSGIPEDRVVNVGNGVAAPFCLDGPRCEPGYPYILYVGNSRPHKNLDRLVRAFRGLNCPELHLVLAGTLGPALAAPRVHVLAGLADDELAALYRGALLLVLPSLIEGFGLPALEAMACGTPVVASGGTALEEVVGEAGLLIDPLDVRDITRAIESLLDDRGRREEMRARGIVRARRYSWDRVGTAVRSVLECAAHP